MKKQIIAIVAIFLITIIITGCVPLEQKDTPSQEEKEQTIKETTQELKKFSTKAELVDYLKENQQTSDYYGGFTRNFGMMDSIAMVESTAAPMAKGMETAQDYSETNVQVKGVDEADFVKNDNKYIYTIVQDKLVIVDAFPAKDAEILSKTEIKGSPRDLFINDDRLVIFTEDNKEVQIFPEYSYIPQTRYTTQTHALIYDITDRKEPKLVKDYNLKGNYYQSRMINDYVYFIVKDNVYHYNNFVDTPVIREATTKIISPEIYYFDNPEQNYVFHTIASFDISKEKDNINANTYLMGYSNNLYVSKENIYLTYQKNLPYRYQTVSNQERFYKVVVPLLPNKVQAQINNIKKNDDLNSYEKWDQISVIMENMYNTMNEKEKRNLLKEISEDIEEYELKKEQERRKTIIHKIAIDNGKIDYKTRGEVNGYLLNQFSMDEYDTNLRVATTTYLYTRHKSTMHNNVYVLDKNLKEIGKIEEIAENEKIYSTRFISNRLYMVTFQRIDPFFVIDLSDPKNPEILGELKIPGFSDYLHPYDENHIIGIGKETKENQWGGVSIQGVKLALFDVSDVNNPKQVDVVEIGTSGSDSEALREHKAFLFDKKKNLLVIPVREIKGPKYFDSDYGYYKRSIWQGAYVFKLTEEGFEEKGKISHYDGNEDDRYYWGSPYAVRRSLYMDDTLYTISAKKIKMNNLNDVEEINEVELPYKIEKYYRPMYR